MGDTPVTIVRPSIICGSLQYPSPGWIDSFAALAGPISAFALGGLKVLHGDPSTILDVVPVDSVANCIIDEALLPPTYGSFDPDHLNEKSKVVHCVSTTDHGPKTWDVIMNTITYFEQPENVVLYKPKGYYIGNDDRWFYFYEFFFQYLPIKFAELGALMMLDWDGAAKARKTLQRLEQIDTHFRYFNEHTYDYRCAVPVLAKEFDRDAYFGVVLAGMRQNLLMPLVGRMKARAVKANDAQTQVLRQQEAAAVLI